MSSDPNDLAHFVAAVTGTSDTWIERVRAADAEAELAWQTVDESTTRDGTIANALIAIAAELRSQRIARRPGGGQ